MDAGEILAMHYSLMLTDLYSFPSKGDRDEFGLTACDVISAAIKDYERQRHESKITFVPVASKKQLRAGDRSFTGGRRTMSPATIPRKKKP